MAKKDILFKPYKKGDEHRLHWYDRELARVMSHSMTFWQMYFRYEVRGLENLPKNEGALLANNHGLWPFDAMLLAKRLFEEGRPLRALAEHSTWRIPFVREIFLNLGVVDGTPKNAIRLLRDDELVLVFPGGAREGLKSSADKYRLFWERRTGFVKVAIAAGKPIIPCFCAGIDDVYHIFNDGYALGKKLFRAYFPLTAFIGFGLMPFPVKLTHHIGKPIYHDLKPTDFRDEKKVARLHARVLKEALKLKEKAL